ncbi:hypothetical protein GGR92_001177 [Spirosoma lacussanchae]
MTIYKATHGHMLSAFSTVLGNKDHAYLAYTVLESALILFFRTFALYNDR